MKKVKILAILSVIIFISNSISAQDEEQQPPKVLVMGVPQYLFKHGLRIDIDVASKDYKAWWVISPLFFIDVSEAGGLINKRYTQLHGYGLTINRKSFLSSKNTETGVYVSGGIGYQYFNILTSKERWDDISFAGLNTLQIVNDNYHVYINKVLTEATIGYKKHILSRLYIDVYAGVGLRYSFYDQPAGSDLKFNRTIFDFGYTGTAFIAGLRLGVGL